jgi:hypothetical protein
MRRANANKPYAFTLLVGMALVLMMTMPTMFEARAAKTEARLTTSSSSTSQPLAMQAAASGCTDASFIQPKGSPVGVGSVPRSVAVGDFNQDGNADLATANENSSNVTIQLGDGSGGFTEAAGSPVGVGSVPRSVAVGDFDQDGKLDLATPNEGSDNVTILLGNGGGGFTEAADSPVDAGSIPISVAVRDFNLDGKADLATANYNSNNVTILLGNGSGGFTEAADSPFSVGSNPYSVAVGDFNQDGKTDLATANDGDNNVTILLGNGSGGFTEAADSPVGVGNDPTSVAVGDFDQDGKADLAVANFFSDNVTILLGDGSGGFSQAPGSPVGAGSFPVSVAVGDFNQDGNADLATANQFSDNVTILLGNGSGGFTEAPGSPFGVGTRPLSVAVGDFNLDGKADLATANGNSNNVTILLNTCDAFPCNNTSFAQPKGSPVGVGSFPFSVAVGDFNQDGNADLATANLSSNVTILLGNGSGGFSQAGSPVGVGNSPHSVAVGDFNLDGKADLATANAASHNVTILLGNGSGGFSQAGSPVGVGDSPRSVAVEDFNQDGKADLATANQISNNVTILLGNGSGGFSQAGSPVGVGSFPRSLATGDFNLDGKADLAVANGLSDNVTILLGNGSGGFSQAGSPVGVGDDPVSIAVGDFNQDGKADLATANNGSSNVTILLGNGSGGFSQAGSPFGVGGIPQSVAIGDFNLDGKADLATANQFSDNVTILLGNGSGGFTEAPGSPFGAGNDPTSVAVGDFNLDGKTDLATANFVTHNVTILLNTCDANTPTIITTPLSRNAGSPSANSQIATVNDLQDTEDTLTVTVNGGASATVTGVTVSGISVSAAGVVTADVVAACDATTANFTLRVTDSGDLFSEATLTVTVTPENQPPTLTCPANIMQSTAANQCTAAVDYTLPAITDNCPCDENMKRLQAPSGGSGCSVTCTPPPGSSFPKGTTTVTCTATDAAGNTGSCTFTVTVNDTQAPTLTCPANLSQSTDPNQCSATVSYTTPTASDNCPGATASCNPASGSSFAKGTTTVTCTATDAAGNTGSCTFTVTVNDTQAPTLTCPANLTAVTNQAVCVPPGQTVCQMVNFATPIASDNCPKATVVCTPPSGSCFPTGVTTVTCTATDAAGNTASCSFTVTVFDVCLQDDNNANSVLLFNSLTGDYRFCCNGSVFTGRGKVSRQGCTITLEHNAVDRRVLGKADKSIFRGNGSIQTPPGTTRCTISDRDIRNNSCACVEGR